MRVNKCCWIRKIRHKDLISSESDHRLINGLQMVSSLLSLQSRESHNVKAAEQLKIAANRVATVGSVHKRLHALDYLRRVELKHFLGDLCHDMKDIFDRSSMRPVGNEDQAEPLHAPRGSMKPPPCPSFKRGNSALPATLNVIFGPCAAGKTTYAHALARREGAVAFVLDEWGARLFGPDLQGPIEFAWMLERLGRCNALIWSTAEAVLAAGASVVLDTGAMRRADRERIRQIAAAKSLSLQWHFVDAPQEVRRARVADRNTAKGETFVMEVTPEMFEMLEAIYEPPVPAELEGAVRSASDDETAAALVGRI